jgi:hypothetical protein
MILGVLKIFHIVPLVRLNCVLDGEGKGEDEQKSILRTHVIFL